MGYFAVGFAFNQKPNWQAVQALLPDYRIQGYKHRDSSLYLLDVWKADVQSTRQHHPFTGDFYGPRDFGDALAKIESPAGDKFDAVIERFGVSFIYAPGWLKIAPAIARAAGTETFFFRVNDDEYHFACLADPGTAGEPVKQLAFRFEDLRLTMDGPDLLAQLYEPEDFGSDDEDDEDEERADPEEMRAALAEVPGLKIDEELLVTDGFIIYQELIETWPKAWGDAEELLGWGTFDPFMKLDELFVAVP